MAAQFDHFIILAGMRTGSNFLEANINQFPGLACHGEAFNPSFLCYPDGKARFGFTLEKREADPLGFIRAMREGTRGLAGFRFFHDHDPRVLRHCLADRRCAKIVLSRNPLESYISRKIARETGQWKLTDARHAKAAKVRFDRREFEEHLVKEHSWRAEIRSALQKTGQAGFYLDYEDIADIDVLNGLARFLGQPDRIKALSGAVRKQNPDPPLAKVTNPAEMRKALSELDPFGLSRLTDFEPARGALVSGYVAGASAPILYLPVQTGLEGHVMDWMAELEGVERSELGRGFTQKTLRQWKRRHPGHRSFTVVRHPLARAHAAFCNHILNRGEGGFAAIRESLRRNYGMALPEPAPAHKYDRRAHRRAFLCFLRFLKMNLAGQTGIRIDPSWASQSNVIRGFAGFALPDMVLRAESLGEGLPRLAAEAGVEGATIPDLREDHPVTLAEIHDDELEAASRDAYQRDYMMFGYRAWKE